ncbi:tyrosine-type recombinase/integrase [Actinoplanes sp. NPDC048791]|uniref:tyrosine-type recombinase/integrase n=1 Tax=Actinoplanes sp. NPDC048791 TaxID=3154623 RepID=UPI00340D35B0
MVRLHDTRHGACSLMLAGEVPIEIVQLILGHSSPEVTRRVYARLCGRRLPPRSKKRWSF